MRKTSDRMDTLATKLNNRLVIVVIVNGRCVSLGAGAVVLHRTRDIRERLRFGGSD